MKYFIRLSEAIQVKDESLSFIEAIRIDFQYLPFVKVAVNDDMVYIPVTNIECIVSENEAKPMNVERADTFKNDKINLW